MMDSRIGQPDGLGEMHMRKINALNSVSPGSLDNPTYKTALDVLVETGIESQLPHLPRVELDRDETEIDFKTNRAYNGGSQ